MCSVQDQKRAEQLCNNTTHELVYLYFFFSLPSKARGYSVIASHNIKLLIKITVYLISASGTPHPPPTY